MKPQAVEPVVSDGFTLRTLAERDLPTTLEWRNHPDSRVWFLTTQEVSWETHQAWFAKYLDKVDDVVFVVDNGQEIVAQVALYDIADGHAEFGRLLVAPGARGLGLSHIAIDLCMRVADEQLGLESVVLEVRDDNHRAIAGYERAGFVRDDAARRAPDTVVFVRRRS